MLRNSRKINIKFKFLFAFRSRKRAFFPNLQATNCAPKVKLMLGRRELLLTRATHLFRPPNVTRRNVAQRAVSGPCEFFSVFCNLRRPALIFLTFVNGLAPIFRRASAQTVQPVRPSECFTDRKNFESPDERSVFSPDCRAQFGAQQGGSFAGKKLGR